MSMLAYKGFKNDLTCTLGRGTYRFKENIWHEEKQANCVQNGFHCAEDPLDCLFYYPDWDTSAYYLVEAAGDIDEDGRDSKISCTRLKLLKKLDMFDFVNAAVEYICHHPERKIDNRTHGKIHVKKSEGRAKKDGAVIVYGEAPMAAGPDGSILALIKMDQGNNIAGVCVRKVDGTHCKPDTWYQI